MFHCIHIRFIDANHKFVHAPDDHFFLQQGEAGIFPCIATHPNVTMSLFRINRYNINGVVEINTEEVMKNVVLLCFTVIIVTYIT